MNNNSLSRAIDPHARREVKKSSTVVTSAKKAS